MESSTLTDNVVSLESEGVVCPFCKMYNGEIVYVKDWLKKPIAHMVVTLMEDGSTHVHGPIEDKKMMTRLIDAAMVISYKKERETEQTPCAPK
jgi:exopolysaccharide biosynthesis protein